MKTVFKRLELTIIMHVYSMDCLDGMIYRFLFLYCCIYVCNVKHDIEPQLVIMSFEFR